MGMPSLSQDGVLQQKVIETILQNALDIFDED